MERMEKKKLNEANVKGYQDGMINVVEEYKRTTWGMVNEAITIRIPIAYRVGYKDGARAMAGVMQMDPCQELMGRLPEPQVPKFELPYTTEQCEPLPPEEDDEEEEEEEAAGDEHQGKGWSSNLRTRTWKLTNERDLCRRRFPGWSVAVVDFNLTSFQVFGKSSYFGLDGSEHWEFVMPGVIVCGRVAPMPPS